uniref:Dihydroorotase (EC) n=1 Tax=uncultured Thiotrichaceae bacterium TaxID=298394 RepID=A0A6S6U792_9GAMM|nr:MAG: Dihydroorotase (EC [uncultured Thiotrichaceae bacterium]
MSAIGTVSASGLDDSQIIDAAGRFLLPGMIDNYVHFREPGMTLISDMASESAAAVAGGVTSFLDSPDLVSGTRTLAALEEKKQLAHGRSRANFGFYLGAARSSLEQIKAIDSQLACAVNVYLGCNVENDARLLDDIESIEAVFRDSPLLVTAHCEDMPTILENEESYRSIYAEQVPMEFHPIIRSESACVVSTELALDLAKQYGTRLHLMHISTAAQIELLADVDLSEKQITAEVCPQHLHFSDEDYAKYGALIKYDPAIKTAEDRAALIQGLLDGRLDVVGSGHAPHPWEQKQNRNYFDVPSGIPMVQYALLTLLENYHDGIFSMELIAQKTSHAPADLFDIRDRGYIREGYWADLVLIDVNKGGVATHSSSLSRCGWTAFDGYKFRSTIAATIVNGRLVWSEGRFQDVKPSGMALEYDRESLQ